MRERTLQDARRRVRPLRDLPGMVVPSTPCSSASVRTLRRWSLRNEDAGTRPDAEVEAAKTARESRQGSGEIEVRPSVVRSKSPPRPGANAPTGEPSKSGVGTVPDCSSPENRCLRSVMTRR